MGTIETWIREGIAKVNAADADGRNRVYLAARQAILKLPLEKQPSLVSELTAAVKAIEFEFAKRELLPEKELTSSTENKASGSLQALEDPGHAGFSALSMDEAIALASEAPSPKPALRIAAVGGVLLAVGLAGYLLWQQLAIDRVSVASLENTETVSSSSNATEPATVASPGGSTKTVFSYTDRTHLALLSNSPQGDVPLLPSGLDNPDTPDISLATPAAIFASKPITLDRNKLYLMRFELRVDPPDAVVEVNAGFSTIPGNQQDRESINSKNAYFVHEGTVKKSNPRASNGVYLFSGIADWQSVGSRLDLDTGASGVRPAIVALPKSDKTRLWLVSLTVNEL